MSFTVEKSELLLASLYKQHLLEKTSSREVVSTLCGLQAQFANYPKHAFRIRAHDYHGDTWKDGLVKTWTFRGTLHLVNRDELGMYLSALGVPGKWDDGWGIAARAKPRLSSMLLGWIHEGVCEREELKRRCRARGIADEVVDNVFHGWGGLMKEMCRRGLIAYAPGTEKHFLPCADVTFTCREAARAELAGRYFRYMGPATVDDFATFSGYTKKTALTVLENSSLPLRSVRCEGSEYFYLDDWDSSRGIPRCLFLAGFDQLLLAYRDRSRLLDDRHRPDVVTNTGIIHPTVLVDGRLRARWKLVKRDVMVYPFAKLSAAGKKAIQRSAKETFGEEMRNLAFA